MKSGTASGNGKRYGILALLVAGGLVFQAPAGGALLATDDGQQVQPRPVNTPESAVVEARGPVRAGPGVGRFANLPVLDPVTVDYRDSSAPESRATVSAATEPGDGTATTRTGGACLIDAHCVTGDVCQTYACSGYPGKCVYTSATGPNDPTCDDDLYCNGAESCSGPGNCLSGAAPCTGGDVCDEVADSCYPPCEEFGANGCDDGNPDTRDTCSSGVCLHENLAASGRCCAGDGTCTAGSLADCEAAGGVFLAMAGPCGNVQPSGNYNDCPDYSSGIAPSGVWSTAIGPISNLAFDSLVEVGDDYVANGYFSGKEFLSLEILRFAGGTIGYNPARWSISFYDENGAFVENLFYPSSNDDSGGLGVRTVVLDPPLIIPAVGYVTFQVQGNFTYDGRVVLLATDSVDVGVNNSSTMWVNGGPVSDFLGQCLGGDREGEWCDRTQGNTDCPGNGTCNDIPDVLAFELVGTPTYYTPLGACCDNATGECMQTLSWPCTNAGGIFRGVGTFCGICPDGTTPCSDDDACDPPNVGSCMLIPACETGACCNLDTGTCDEISDSASCVDGTLEFHGFGTDCDPNCCEQPSYTGGDNCSLATPYLITVPSPGEAPTYVTITGDNSAATYDDFGVWSADSIFDVNGATRDSGWWEVFGVDDCAMVRIDLCCTDAGGSPMLPAWSHLYDSCPTGPRLEPSGVDPPIGIGRGTGGFGYGEPFCDEDNLWQTYQLRAGTYYYPIYSAPGGTSAVPPGAPYQLHITVAACDVSVCCTGSSCKVVNEFDCADLGGNWLLGAVDCGMDPTCIKGASSDSPCCTGACCVGSDCMDEIPGPSPLTEADCDILEGEYSGGASCGCSFGLVPPCAGEDCNGNGIPDECDLSSGTSVDTDGNGVPDECEQACCYESLGYPACQAMSADECGILGGVVQPSWVRCSTSNVTEVSHVSGPFTHVTNVSQECPAGISRMSGCLEQDPIDAWQTSPDAFVCHQFGVQESPAIPADFFGPGSDPFDGEVCLQGEPIGMAPTPWENLDFGEADTLVLRLGDPFDVCATISAARSTVPARVIALNLRSIYPITVTYNGGQNPQQWHLAVNLSEITPPDGSIIAVKTHENGGTYESVLHVQPKYTFTSVANPENELVLDTGVEGQDYIVLQQPQSAEAPWAIQVIGTPQPVSPICTFFRPGIRDMRFRDCNNNGFADGCDIWAGRSDDCQPNGIPDECDIASGRSSDQDENGEPDECYEPPVCTVSSPPQVDPSPDPVDTGSGTKNRYLSFAGGDPGQQQAVQVTFDALPAGFEYANGRTMWVQEPFRVTENSGGDGAGEPGHWAATLGCSPHYADDWNTFGAIDVSDPGVIPGGIYNLRIIDETCDLQPAGYSEPLEIVASAAGDVVGSCSETPCTAPQGTVDFVDISGVVDKFKNLVGSPRKARADLVGNSPSSASINRKVDFVDIGFVVDAFRTQAPPPEGPPELDPCE